MPPPKAFISYSWDSESHKQWVSELAARLRHDGVEARLDQWHTEFGDQFTSFMEKEIRDNDFVLIICTPNYSQKSNKRTGGVGYEGHIMTADVAQKGNHRKYIPVLALGSWNDAAPSWLKGKKYVDLRTPKLYESNYPKLVATLLGTAASAPPVGPSSNSNRAPRPNPNVQNSPRAKPTEPSPSRGTKNSPDDGNRGPIRIVGVITDEVTTPTHDGSPGSALYAVPLRLSRQPTALWAELFVATWNSPPSFSTMHRPGIATVQGSRIVLNGTTLEEIEIHHRDTLVLCVNVANQKEAEIIQTQRREKERRRRQADDHRREVEERAKKLTFG